MKFQTPITVLGMKASKGTMDNGQSFDSTKVYSQTDLDDSKGNAKGFAATEYTYGDSTNFDKYKHLSFPFDAIADIEITTNGKTQKAVVVGLKPVASPSAKAAAS